MVKWKFINNQKEINNWNKEIYNFSDGNYFQSIEWANYKFNYGWDTYRFIAQDRKGKILSLAQILVRVYPFSNCIAWCPGGPIGNVSTINEDFINICVKAIGCSKIYLRISPLSAYELINKDKLISNGWKSPKYKLSTGLSMHINLTIDKKILYNNLSKNWKRNLKRFKEDRLTISKWDKPEIESMINLYSKMESYKNIRQQHTKQSLSDLFKYFGSNIIIFRCDYDNELVAIRAALIDNNKGRDLLAATDQIARKYYGSHALFWNLLMYCKTTGVTSYDLSGINPKKGGTGVYNFKKGTGANLVTYLGEWEWGSNTILTMITNYVIKSKNDTF